MAAQGCSITLWSKERSVPERFVTGSQCRSVLFRTLQESFSAEVSCFGHCKKVLPGKKIGGSYVDTARNFGPAPKNGERLARGHGAKCFFGHSKKLRHGTKKWEESSAVTRHQVVIEI